MILNLPVPEDTEVFWEILEANASDFFQTTSGSFPIAKNGSSGTFPLKPINDNAFKGNKVFSIKLSSTLSTLVFEGSGPNKSYSFDLLDDEAKPKVAFATASQSVAEGLTSGSVRISMSVPLAEGLSVTYSVAGTATSGGITT